MAQCTRWPWGMLDEEALFAGIRNGCANRARPCEACSGNRDAIAGGIGEVLAGMKPGCLSDQYITALGMVGQPFDNLVTAWHLDSNAQSRGIETKVILARRVTMPWMR